MTDSTPWWRSACRLCGGQLAPIPSDLDPRVGPRLWRLCRACVDTRAGDELDGSALWDHLALTGDPGTAPTHSGLSRGPDQ